MNILNANLLLEQQLSVNAIEEDNSFSLTSCSVCSILLCGNGLSQATVKTVDHLVSEYNKKLGF